MDFFLSYLYRREGEGGGVCCGHCHSKLLCSDFMKMSS